jgi:hypothetical protein
MTLRCLSCVLLAIGGGWTTQVLAAPTVTIDALSMAGSSGPGDSFDWRDDGPLSLEGTVVVASIEKPAKAELLLVLFDEQGAVAVKQKSSQTLGPGRHKLSIPAVLDCAAVFGRRSYRAVLKVEVKGAGSAEREALFTVSGPPPPTVTFHQLEIFDPQQGRGSGARTFAPGETFAVDAIVEIGGNSGAVDPELRIFAAMLEDIRDVDPAAEHQPWIEHWDVRRLGAGSGSFRIYATGRLPVYFYDAYQQDHRFSVELRLSFGPGAVSRQSVEGRIIDFQNGDNRRNDDLRMRTIELARAYTWDVRPLAQALADDAVAE